jgi:Domain of unknown function (DUF4965)/Domain of unknown function (DUF1793)/Domain of unknown function (DUF5127)/Domain of unknown function (DUF4964)
MKITNRTILSLVLLIPTFPVVSQQVERPPATPLIAHDPYFSVWSATDKLTDSPTIHWTGHPEPLIGLVRVDGKPFRIIGRDPSRIPAMEQTAMHLSFTHIRYSFRAAGIEIDLTFFTPAFLDDLEVLSRPVTYLTWTAHAIDGGSHAVSVFLEAQPDIATSYPGQPVTFSRHLTTSETVVSVGTRQQAILNRSGDDLRIDWGYFHIAVPNDAHGMASITPSAEATFIQDGSLPSADDMEGVPSRHSSPRLAVAIPLGSVGENAVSRHILLSYTEDFAIQFLQTNLRPYWQRNNMPIANMLDTAEHEHAQLEKRGQQMDEELERDLTKTAGQQYTWLCILAYRQSIAAHKLVADRNGDPMLFAKENFSNGDISTVDVMYPSAPIFLFFNPRLLEAQVLPVLEYAAMPNHWHFPFAPHDLGQYPLANGQDYGGGEKTEENQMPVEESGNLIILVDAIARTEGHDDLAQRFWPQLTQWAEYLRQHGLDPENQLTTDDFAGHVAHNSNLSIKAIDALAAYADLAALLHHENEAKSYKETAQDMAHKWIGMAAEGDHYKLAFNSPGTWSQKYNLVWDKVLDYNLFSEKVRATEIAYYLTKMNTYGLPLDSRADYTKLDWELWTATLADRPADFQALIQPIYRWTNETPTRVPMTDWYDTKTGKQVGFQARSVVGGIFIKALSDRTLAEKWRAKASSSH